MPWIIAGIGGCGCLVAIILAVVGVTFTAKTVMKTTGDADAAARQFLELVQKRQFDQAYALTSKTWKAELSQRDFREFCEQWVTTTGEFGPIDRVNTNMQSNPRGNFATLVYQVKGKRRDSEVQIALVGEGGGWRVQACNYKARSRPGE